MFAQCFELKALWQKKEKGKDFMLMLITTMVYSLVCRNVVTSSRVLHIVNKEFDNLLVQLFVGDKSFWASDRWILWIVY